MSKISSKPRKRRSYSVSREPVASVSQFPMEGRYFINQPDSSAVLELQRVSNLFQNAPFISEAEFVVNCKSVMNLLQYSRREIIPQEQELIVDVTEKAIIAFVVRILPLVFQELVAPTSLLHPISPPVIMSLLEFADAHVSLFGDYILQLRVASARLLIEESQDVALAFSMCQMLPRIQPSSHWQPVMNPVKSNPACNMHGSISLPEIHPPTCFSEGPSLDNCPSSFGSPIPSLSSLLNCTSPTSTSVRYFDDTYDPNHVNIITESLSEPAISLSARSSLPSSLSVPHLGNISPCDPETMILPPVIASEEIVLEHNATSEVIFSPSLFSPDRHGINEAVSPTAKDTVVLDIPDICVESASAGNEAIYPDEHGPLPEMSLTSQDVLTQMILPDVNDNPPSLWPLAADDRAPSCLQAGFSISIEPTHTDHDFACLGSDTQPLPLSAIPNQPSSPLSSPSPMAFVDDSDIFRNIFELDILKRPPSPYNKRQRSASNTPQPTPSRIGKSTRAVSVSINYKEPLDPGLATLTLPPPANPRSNNPQSSVKIRQKSKRVVSAPMQRSRRKAAPLDSDLASLPPPPAPASTFQVTHTQKSARGRRTKAQTKRDAIGGQAKDIDGVEPAQGSKFQSRRSTSTSVNKENI